MQGRMKELKLFSITDLHFSSSLFIEYAEDMDIMTEEASPTNMPPNTFGELPDIDELFMQYPELNVSVK